ncbi:MAG: serine/threonine-protein kinase, partial [Gemmataceae bacterium]
MLVFLRCIGEAVAAEGFRALAGMVPMGDVIYNVAANAIERYRRENREAQMRQDAERVIQAGMEQVREDAKQIAREVLDGQPEENIAQLERYLTQVPAVARQSLKRPADLTGKTIPGEFNLLDPIQLGNLLPKRLPRFNAGEPVPHAPMWRFVDLLGAGGFGEVWLAKHTFLDEQRAFKFCIDPEARERLLKHEGEVVKRVMAASKSVREDEHGIVPLVDAFLEGETPWLAYEYVQGGDLSNIVREHANKSPEVRGKRTLEIIAHLAEVIGRFHTLPQPIIHRDLTPANILLKRNANRWLIRVTDFGISQVAAAHGIHQATVSTPSLNLGETYRGAHTPIYASPQQKRRMKPDVRDDVHALGIIGYQLLVGDLAAERPAGRWRKRLAECQLPDEVLDLLESCWDDDPAERPDNAAVLSRKVRELINPAPKTPGQTDLPPKVTKASSSMPLVDAVTKHPRGIDENVIRAWEKVGAKFGWLHYGKFYDEKPKSEALPGFLFHSRIDANLFPKLPAPQTSFFLNLGDNEIGAEGARALAASPHLANLTYLNLDKN